MNADLPPYIYGREAARNEKVWTEDAVRTLAAQFHVQPPRAALYYKVISQNRGTVIANIHRYSDGEIQDWDWFIGFLNTQASLERRFKKAHAWADARMALMHKHTVLEAPQP